MIKRQVVAAMGLLVNDEGKFLLTLRKDSENANLDNKWHIPGGGIEHGENPLDALQREIKEELGVEVEVITLLPLVGSSVWNNTESEEHALLLCFLCKIKSGTIILDGTESVEYKWVSLSDMEHLNSLRWAKEFVLLADSFMKNK